MPTTSSLLATTTAASRASVPPQPAARPPDLEPPADSPLTRGDPDEATLMDHLRGARADPSLAIELAREGDDHFPGSADAPERASIRIHALADEGRGAQARGEAESVVNRYPDSAWIREIEDFTGAHRHRSLRLTADGSLEYY
jgi:hypothetical protein